METIGNRISKHRKLKGMTQEELAEIMGVSGQAVSKWETDASCPDIASLPQLCRVLGISVDELLSGATDQVRQLPENQRKPLEELTLRVRVNSVDGDKVRVNIPMTLVKLAMEIGVTIGPNIGGEHADLLKSVDMEKVLQMVEHGLIGKLVDIESSNGDIIEVVVE